MTASSVYKAPKRKLEISFGGCGFLGVYHVGVGKCVVDHVPHLFDEFSGFYGASAGAITAVCAACKSDPMVPYKWVKKTFEASREYKLLGVLHPRFDLYERLREFLEGFLPENAHKLCRNKVKISLTIFNEEKTLPKTKNWLVSNFTTRNELINAIIASSFIPGYAGLKDLPKFRGKRCCDGGFTSNVPLCQDPNVITVSPFSGECDICPLGESHSPHLLHIVDQSLQLSTRNIHRLFKALLPTSWSDLEELFYSGYKDAYRFFKLEGIISEALVRPIGRRSTISVMDTRSNRSSAKFSSMTTLAVERDEEEDDSSGYGSQSSEFITFRGHRRHCSITVSTTGDFFSCVSEEEVEREREKEREERERERGGEKEGGDIDGVKGLVGERGGEREGGGGREKKPKVPSYLRALWQEMDILMREVERAKRGEDMDRGQQPSSWSRWVWLVQSCSPSRLPIIRSIIGSHGNDQVAATTGESVCEPSLCCDSESCGHSGILHSILSSWISSVTVM